MIVDTGWQYFLSQLQWSLGWVILYMIKLVPSLYTQKGNIFLKKIETSRIDRLV